MTSSTSTPWRRSSAPSPAAAAASPPTVATGASSAVAKTTLMGSSLPCITRLTERMSDLAVPPEHSDDAVSADIRLLGRLLGDAIRRRRATTPSNSSSTSAGSRSTVAATGQLRRRDPNGARSPSARRAAPRAPRARLAGAVGEHRRGRPRRTAPTAHTESGGPPRPGSLRASIDRTRRRRHPARTPPGRGRPRSR